MSILYCAETGGFYLPGMQPAGMKCKEITNAFHVELREAQYGGKLISADLDGSPILIDPPLPTLEARGQKERVWRDRQLMLAAGMRDRHRDQVELEVPQTLRTEQFFELLEHIQLLRDWPQALTYPDIEYRPAVPSWLVEIN